MNLFQRKPKHQLIGEYDQHNQLCYHCSVCKRTFSSAEYATTRREYCCGKRCYTEHHLFARVSGVQEDALPDYLMQISEIKATGRITRKGQEPIAYLHYELASLRDGGFTGYYALYDVRECVELAGATVLPELS